MDAATLEWMTRARAAKHWLWAVGMRIYRPLEVVTVAEDTGAKTKTPTSETYTITAVSSGVVTATGASWNLKGKMPPHFGVPDWDHSATRTAIRDRAKVVHPEATITASTPPEVLVPLLEA